MNAGTRSRAQHPQQPYEGIGPESTSSGHRHGVRGPRPRQADSGTGSGVRETAALFESAGRARLRR